MSEDITNVSAFQYDPAEMDKRRMVGLEAEQRIIAAAPMQPNITFAMIKSDAFRNLADKDVLQAIRKAGFVVLHSERNIWLTPNQIHAFYGSHHGRPYYDDLVNSVNGGVMPMILEHPSYKNAITSFRKLIGATDARAAEPGTIRARFGGHNYHPAAPMAFNAIHGSDSLASMLTEIETIFGPVCRKIRSHRFGDFYLQDIDPNAAYPS